ncbi:MAG: hypothetical protein U1E45_22580 [Geminicoccaceae bacterium]
MTEKAGVRQRLVEYLVERAFQPVLQVDPERYPENQRAKLANLQRATENEIDRFQTYDTPEKVVAMFHDDITSGRAKEVHRQLHDLGLPTLDDVRGDFERLAERLGVTGRRGH